jgi:hypothetical protein
MIERITGAACVLAAALALSGCKIKEKPQPTHRGVYSSSQSLNTFIPCGEDKLYWVEGKAKSSLQTRYGELTRRPFQPIYIEIKAQVMPRTTAAPMEGHEGSIRVDTVLTATTQVPLECRPKGSDPRDF